MTTTLSTEELGALLHQAPDAVIFSDLDGTIQYWNAAAERIWGHSVEQAMGQNLDLIIPEQFRDAHWRGFERATSEGVTKFQGQSLPTRSMRADGSEIYVELSLSVVRDEAGGVTGALAYARDITERFTRDRETRRRLRTLEQELETLRGKKE
jgi:PAS domain S-box-containing protein